MLLLRPVRATRSLPLYELARRTGISPSRLSLIEREIVIASSKERQKIAQSLRVKARVLFQPATVGALVGDDVVTGDSSEP